MNEKAQSLLEAARREIERKRTKRALKYLNEAANADPSAHEILRERAALAISPLRNFADAVEDLNKAIELAPDVGDYYDLRGQAFWYLREYERALDDFNRAIEVDASCARAYYHRGNFFEKHQPYESALADMKRAVELEPESTSYRHRLVELEHTAARLVGRPPEEAPAAIEEEEATTPAAEQELPVTEVPPIVTEGVQAPPAPAKAVSKTAEEPIAQPAQPAIEAEAAEPVAEPEPPTAEPVPEKWTVRIPSGERFGPASMALLRLWAGEQRVKPGDQLLSPRGAWVSASSVPELVAVFENLRTLKKPPMRPD